MPDDKLARLRTHRDNIRRYRRLLGTKLTELERQFIEKRLAEERAAMENIAASPFLPAFKFRCLLARRCGSMPDGKPLAGLLKNRTAPLKVVAERMAA